MNAPLFILVFFLTKCYYCVHWIQQRKTIFQSISEIIKLHIRQNKPDSIVDWLKILWLFLRVFFPWNLVLMSNFLFSLDLIWSWISLLWHWFSWSWFERHHWWPQGLHSRLQCLSPRHPNPHSIGTIKTHQQASKDVLRSPLYVRAHHMFSRILCLQIHEKISKKNFVCYSKVRSF